MSQSPSSADWRTARGDKWHAQVDGMEAMLAPVEDPLVRASVLDAPLRIADVGCGGGATTFAIARHAPAGSVVDGYDISPRLVEHARGRVAPGEQAIRFHLADASKASPPERYGRVVSRFGVMFFEDPQAAFSNLASWLAPEGRIAFAVWAPPSENPWNATVREVVARIVDVPAPEPDAPGPFRYGDASKFVALLERSGFADLVVRDWRGALPMGGGLPAARAAEFALASSAFGELLGRAGEDAVREATRALTETFGGQEEGGVVRLGACVHLVTGVRR